MRAKFIFELAVNTHDKYYASPELVDHVVNKALDVIGKENISEIIEPSAGDGAFMDKLDSLGIPIEYYDLYPEHHRIKPQDFSILNLLYKKGRLFLGGPPYAKGSTLWKMFVKRAAEMGDYIAYISPPSMHEENPYPEILELLYSEMLQEQTFFGSKVRNESDVLMKSCFNIYKVIPKRILEIDLVEEQLNKDFSIGQYERRQETPGYRKKPPYKYEYYLSNWGLDLGNWYDNVEDSKATSIGIIVHNKALRQPLEDFLNSFRDNYYEYFKRRSTGAPSMQVKKFKEILKDQIY